MFNEFVDYVNGCEAIDFQVRSKLFKDLTNIFQMGFEFRQSIDIGMIQNRGEVAIRNFRAMEMSNYVKKFLMPEFTKVVHMHTGLVVTKVHVHTDVHSGPIGLFAVDLSFGDWQTATTVMDKSTGISKGKLSKDVTEMMEMSQNFNINTGKISDEKYGNNKKISVKMYFDALFAYCLHDFITNVGTEELTAEELTAIMMHEIGHALTFVERAGDFYFQQRRIIDHLTSVKKHGDIKEAIDESYPVLKSALQSFIKDKDSNRKHVAFLMKALDTTKNISDKLKDIPPDTSMTILSAIGNILTGVLVTIAFSYIMLTGGFIIARLLTELMNSMRLGPNNEGKTSDTFSSSHNLRFCERMADEYVSRHGASRYLASGLKKVFESANYLMVGPVSSVTIRNSIVFNLYFKMIIGICGMFGSLVPNYTYEENYNRLKRMVQNAITPLKDPNIPSWLRKELLEDYEQTLKIANSYKGITDTGFMESFTHVIKCLIDPATIIRNITNGGLRRDYEKLNDQIDEVMNNKLYYQSNKLASLVGK